MSTLPNQMDPLDEALSAPGSVSAIGAATAASSDAGGDAVHRQRVERSKRLKLSIFTALLIKPLSFVIPIVTIPLFIEYLGSEERYGLYQSIGALALWLGTVNAGVSLGLINKLTECDVRGDRDAARLYVSTLTIAMFFLFAVASIIWSAVSVSVDWVAVFNVTATGSAEVMWSVWLAGILTLIGLVSGVPSVVYAGYQEIHRANYWDGASKIVLLLSCFALVWIPGLRGFSIIGVLLAVSGVPILLRVVNMIVLFYREKPWLRPSWRLFDFPALRVMLMDGLNLFVLMIAVMAGFQTDKIIISTRISAADVAGYAILGQLFLSAYGLFALILSPLWPAYGDAIRRGDVGWVRRQVYRTRLYGVGLMLACGVGMLLLGNFVIDLLSREQDIRVSASLICAVTAMFMVRAWADSQSIALNAANIFKPQMIIFGGHAVLSILMAIIVAKRFGVEGVAWSASITGLVTSVWGYPWMIRKYILAAEPKLPPPAPPASPRGFEPVVPAHEQP